MDLFLDFIFKLFFNFLQKLHKLLLTAIFTELHAFKELSLDPAEFNAVFKAVFQIIRHL